MSSLSSLLNQILTNLNFTTILLSLITILIIYWYATIPRSKPPGPIGLPVVGSLPFLSKNTLLSLTELGRKYGSIYSLYLGSRLCIVLNDWSSIKAAFIDDGDTFAGRPSDSMFIPTPRNKYNIANAEGALWKEHRRFALQSLRDLGFGKLSIESTILDEISKFLEALKDLNTSRNPIRIKHLLSSSVANNICIMTMGHRFDYDDKKFIRLKYLQDENFNNILKLVPLFIFPLLEKVPGIKTLVGHAKQVNDLNEFMDLCDEEVAEHEESHVQGSRDDYMHAYLSEKKRLDDKEGKNNHVFSREALLDNAVIFFGAGTDTTTNTILWILTFLIKYPEVQKKIHNEIDSVIGRDRLPSYYDDRLRTPYVEAVIHEVMRMRPIVPTNLIHSNIKETVVKGVIIPKRSYILTNIWNVHHDPTLWDNPEEFRPERFIQNDGKVHKPEYLIPFSCGKRQCLGEGLARMEIYLYVVSLLQKFKFSAPHGEDVTTEGDFKFTFSTKMEKIVIEPRELI